MSHQPDERDLFRRLGDDAHRAHLAGPDELRRRSDRRTAARTAAGTVAVVAVVAGIALGANGLSGDAAPDPVGDPTPTVTTSEQPSPTESTSEPSPTESDPTDPATSSVPPPEEVPADAWLSEGELGFSLRGVEAVDVLAPCGQSPFEADYLEGDVVSGGTRLGNYHAPGTPAVNTPDGTITQTIVLMKDEEAAVELWYLMQEAVRGCMIETKNDPDAIRYWFPEHAIPTSSAQPDLSMLIKVSTLFESLFGSPPDAGPDYIDTYVSVLQVGDVVTFLEVRGWEASTTHLEDVDRLAGLATERLLAWRT